MVWICFLILITASLPPGQQGENPGSIAEALDLQEGSDSHPGLALRGGNLIDGTGSLPFGHVDIVIKENRIEALRSVGVPGKVADLVVVAENPLENLKALHGTGAIQLDEANRPVRMGGVRYTINDEIVYDAKTLLSDVARIVAEAKKETGTEFYQTGLAPAAENSR